MPISKILELYSRRGRSLIDHGMYEAAIPISDADTALALFSQQRWRVLGGDVYLATSDGRLETTYENWNYDGRDVDESISFAFDFIHRLDKKPIYVVFVVDD